MHTIKLWFTLCALFSLLAGSLAWTAEDHEIFDLVSSLEAAEGPKTNFYSFLNVSSTATTAEIAKSYRKRSMELHPDRGGDQERFARLGIIAGILRDAEKRKHYHHFYENGVPRWRGTGYYYSRYRPGIGSVLVFLTLLSVLVQYAVQHLSRFSEVQRIRTFQDRAREVAWGSLSNAPASSRVRKRVRVALGPGDNPNNAVTMTVEPDGRVSIIAEDGVAHPLDESAAVQPSFSSTWLPKLVRSTIRRVTGQPPAAPEAVSTNTAATTVDAVGEDSENSRPGTPVEGGPANRKMRREEAKQLKKRK